MEPDFLPAQNSTNKNSLNNLEESADSAKTRAKSSNRMHYDAQVLVIKKQLGGDLEKVRTDLGLSQRKMAQLLMVDPSAWTRWTKTGEQAPPIIYRALQWYVTLNEKIPGLTPQYFIGRQWVSESSQAWEQEKTMLIESKIKLEMELQFLKEKMQMMDQKIAEMAQSRLPATRGARKAKKSGETKARDGVFKKLGGRLSGLWMGSKEKELK